jgi:tryptophan synthase alpha chain
VISLQQRLTERRDAGKKLLVPYITGGVREDWLDIVRACADAGADAIEIGFPFSDPVMDGPVIQAASVQALDRGVTPAGLFEELASISIDVPLAVMTYVNLVFRYGYDNFAASLAKSGMSGAILPDLPKEAAAEWFAAAAAHDIEPVLLVAPNTPDDRLRVIAQQSKGFVYAIGMLGVTGERSELAASAAKLGARVKAVATLPVLIGIGISTPAQAAEASQAADGVIVGSAVIRRIVDGESPQQIGDFVASLRAGLDNS